MLRNRGFPEARSRLCVRQASFLMTFAMGGVPHTGSQHSETLTRAHPARSAARRLSGLGARSHPWHRPPTPLPGLPAAPTLQSADFLTCPCPWALRQGSQVGAVWVPSLQVSRPRLRPVEKVALTQPCGARPGPLPWAAEPEAHRALWSSPLRLPLSHLLLPVLEQSPLPATQRHSQP